MFSQFHNCSKIASTLQNLVYLVYKLVYRKTIYAVMSQVARLCVCVCVCGKIPRWITRINCGS